MVLNEFQLSLIGAGVGLVVIVWLYNMIQERKHRKAAEVVFKGAQRDVLLEQASGGDPAEESATEPEGNSRIEPAFIPADTLLERTEPTFGTDGSEAADGRELDSLPTAAGEPDESLADRAIEVVLPIHFDTAVSCQRLWQATAGLGDRVEANLRWIGTWGSGWKSLGKEDDLAVRDARVMLQLADRQGPVTELELVSFITAAERLADEETGEVQSPPVEDVLVHARALDEFCASIDIQLSIHLVSPSGSQFPGTKLRGIMEANGFVLGDEGQFQLFNENGSLLLAVSNIDGQPFRADELRNLATHGVTFWFDVPRTPEPVFAYDRMLTIARQLGDAVDGVLVDDQRQPLADAMLGSIRSRIQEIQQKMKASELPAGGRRALRLFR